MTMRKHLLLSLLLLTLTWLPAVEAFAQDYVVTPVAISKDKVKYKGKTYYSHVVLEKQTLFSIAKAYGVTVQEIYDANPDLSVLKKNAIILIPDTGAKGYEKPVEVTDTDEGKTDPGEDLLGENPPEEIGKETSGKEEAPKGYTEYIVKWNDTLSGIAEKFGVSEDSILRYNGLTDSKLRKRQVLKIPDAELPQETASPENTGNETQQAVQPETDQQQTTDTREDETSQWLLFPDFTDGETGDKPQDENPGYLAQTDVNLALVLPFNASGSAVHENSIDFYSGVLLAVRQLAEKEGININLDVYDAAASSERKATPEDLENADFVIGPVGSDAVRATLAQIPARSAVVSPLDQRVGNLLTTSNALIQVPTSYRSQYKDLAAWLREDYTVGEKILLISEKEMDAGDYGRRISQQLSRSGLPVKEFSYGILQGRSVSDNIAALLSADRTSRVVIASEREAFVNDVIRNLNLLRVGKNFDIVLYGPAKYRSFETIEPEALHNLHTHISTAYYIDYTDPAVSEFLLAYRAFFGTEPTQFSFQGRDIAIYLIHAVARYGGDDWKEYLSGRPETLLQLRFDFEPTGFGSYENVGTRRIVYDDDFKISVIR